MRTQPRTTSPGAGWLLVVAASVSLLSPALVAGCADQGGPAERATARSLLHDSAHEATSAPAASRSAPAGEPSAEPATTAATAGADAVPAAAAKVAPINRKIIYDARVELATKNLIELEANLFRLIEAQNGYLADSDRSGARGETQRGTWKVRVPVEGYASFVQGVVGLGELVSTQAKSQDVGAEYYDLDARQNAKRVEEARLLKHLTDSSGRLDEILTYEKELSRVRSEIERMQGRLAMLNNQTSLATVTVVAAEIHLAVIAPPPPRPLPPPPPEIPTLLEKVGRTFTDSLGVLQVLGEAVLLVVVAILPWVPVLVPACFLVDYLARRANVRFADRR